MNLRAALRFLGRLLVILAAAEILPALCSLWYGELRMVWVFVGTALLTGFFGLALIAYGRGQRGDLYRREGILIVVGGWLLASIFGALPYWASDTLPSLADALFESASGFTTTGASVITDIEGSGKGILFWRSFTQWLGGMGIIVLFVALLPELGPGARFLYKLEVPGPTAETLHPRVHDTAAVMWKLYLGMSVAQIVLLMLAGLNLYDAMTHSFSTLSTGGFSPRNTSVAAFDSALVEIIIVVFMILAGTNFSLYYGISKHRGQKLWSDPEFRLYLTILGGISFFIAWDLLADGGYDHAGRALLDSVFQVASILTTTGFASVDYDQWPELSRMLLVILMFVGGCAGSTAGGVKIMRHAVGLKTALREVRLIFSPSTVITILVGGKKVPEGVVRSVAGFFILYFASWALGSVLLTIGGLDLESSSTASIAVLGNIGPGLGAVGPTANFADFASWQKLLMVLLMWLGRLEVYAIAALFTISFWRR